MLLQPLLLSYSCGMVSKVLSHLNRKGESHMVDVGGKLPTRRYAKAEAQVVFPAGILSKVMRGDGPKGGVLGPAKIAGIQAAKRTAELIPLCHALPLDRVELHFRVASATRLEIHCEAWTEAKTGVEMEALTGVTVAALTVYDMSKALTKSIRLENIRLLEKRGGKSGPYRAGR